MRVVKCDACGKEIENDRIFKIHFEVEDINGFNSAKETDEELESVNSGKLINGDYCLMCASILAGMDYGLMFGDEIKSIGKEQEQVEVEEPKVDWSEVKVDTPVLVSTDGQNWHRRYFSRYKDGKVFAWSDGRTSWSADDCSLQIKDFYYNYTKLAESEE